MKRRALTGYVGISANMVKSAPKCCCDKCCRKTETVEGRPQGVSCQTVPGVQGGTGNALENYN